MARNLNIARQLAPLDALQPDKTLADYDAEKIANVAAKAYARIIDAWALNNTVAAELVAVSPRTWSRMKTGDWAGRLSRDQLMRVSAVTGIYKALNLYFGEAIADKWVTLRNTGPLFGGQEPVEAMIEGGLPAILETRNYIDALRGGA